MQISSRFTLAIHILICIETFQEKNKITSNFLAQSTNSNPVIIRNILGQLKANKLISTTRGSGGTTILKPLDKITFFDVYQAVECVKEEELFKFHNNPSPICPVGKNIHKLLDDRLIKVQKVMETELATNTIQDVIDNYNQEK